MARPRALLLLILTLLLLECVSASKKKKPCKFNGKKYKAGRVIATIEDNCVILKCSSKGKKVEWAVNEDCHCYKEGTIQCVNDLKGFCTELLPCEAGYEEVDAYCPNSKFPTCCAKPLATEAPASTTTGTIQCVKDFKGFCTELLPCKAGYKEVDAFCPNNKFPTCCAKPLATEAPAPITTDCVDEDGYCTAILPCKAGYKEVDAFCPNNEFPTCCAKPLATEAPAPTTTGTIQCGKDFKGFCTELLPCKAGFKEVDAFCPNNKFPTCCAKPLATEAPAPTTTGTIQCVKDFKGFCTELLPCKAGYKEVDAVCPNIFSTCCVLSN